MAFTSTCSHSSRRIFLKYCPISKKASKETSLIKLCKKIPAIKEFLFYIFVNRKWNTARKLFLKFSNKKTYVLLE